MFRNESPYHRAKRPRAALSRREFLWRSGGGLGGIALSALLAKEGSLAVSPDANGVFTGKLHRPAKAKKLGLAQHALIGVGSAPGLAGPRMRAWAKWILDQGFAFYERQAGRAGGIAPGVLFGVRVVPQSAGSASYRSARTRTS